MGRDNWKISYETGLTQMSNKPKKKEMKKRKKTISYFLQCSGFKNIINWSKQLPEKTEIVV